MAIFDRSQPRSTIPSGTEPAPASSALAYIPPSMRELRAQAVHRLQVGMFGLAGMLLLVSLANVIMDRAKYLDDTAVNVAPPDVSVSETAANDPLVDMGVAPELPVSGQAKSQATTSPATATPAPSVDAPRP